MGLLANDYYLPEARAEERHAESVRHQRQRAVDLSAQVREKKVLREINDSRPLCCRRRIECDSESWWGRLTNKLKHHPWSKAWWELEGRAKSP